MTLVIILLAIIAATLLFGAAAVMNVFGIIAGSILSIIVLSIGWVTIITYWEITLAIIMIAIFLTAILRVLVVRREHIERQKIQEKEKSAEPFEKDLQGWYEYKSDLERRNIPRDHIGYAEADAAIKELVQRIKDVRSGKLTAP
ncbi:glucose-6-phosphate exchanger SLC37A4 [Azospirillum agricola]|uniref:glucose-6-phosphate exchanger SLC37A4 n=1 Tax=Azospirillum agricola TaxID=1720247 RepID=UPI0011781727|nr:glucose-6-phosphate exchanger SLC37A4 [Azospirillum agricola]